MALHPQLRRHLPPQLDCFGNSTPAFSSLRRFSEERDSPKSDFFTHNFRVCRHRKLASASHRFQKGPLGGDALESIEIIQLLANGRNLVVPLANFDANGGLADARQHFVQFQSCGRSPSGASIGFPASGGGLGGPVNLPSEWIS